MCIRDRSNNTEKLLKLRQNLSIIGLVASRSVSVKCIWEMSDNICLN